MICWSATSRLGAWSFLRYTRHYSRKVSRNPIKVLADEKSTEQFKKWRPIAETSLSQSGQLSPDTTNVVEEPAYLEGKPSRLPPGFPPYEKKGHDDKTLSAFALATSDSTSRLKSGLVMMEGKRLIQEGLDANLTLKALFFSQVEDVTSLHLPPKKFKFQKLTYKKLKRWSKLTTTPGIIGFFQKPDTTAQAQADVFPFSIICDNVRDPQNLGSILRVAASAGCRSIYLSKGCVDLWNDKVLRSAMGSHFHFNIYDDMDWNQLEGVLGPEAFVMFADNKDSEQAVSREIVRDDVYHKSNQQCQQDIRSNHHPSAHHVDFQATENNLPTYVYYLINYSAMKNIFLVLGGETGFSKEALNLGTNQKRFRVNIPMLNNVESLNVASALSILTHEMKRQFELTKQKDKMDSITIPAL